MEWWHGRATGGTGRAYVLTCAGPWKLAGMTMPLLGTAMPDKIVQNLHIFGTNQLQITFLLLQDAIFEIFVPEIK